MRGKYLISSIAGITLLAILSGVMQFASCSKNAASRSAGKQEIIYHCPMHPSYLSHQPGNCPICGMKLVPANSSDSQTAAIGNESGIKIDPVTIQNSNILTEKSALRTLTRDIRTSATVVPDEQRIKTITTKTMGYVEKLHVDFTGQPVKKGQPLYELYSPDIVSAETEYLQTYHTAAPEDSGRLLMSARQRLRNWDVTDDQIAALEKRGAPQKYITAVSPVSGIVAGKDILEGQYIEPGKQLYKIVDYSKVWVEGAVYQQDVPFVSLGQQTDIVLDYYPGERFNAPVIFIAPEMNVDTRTLMVRCELSNTSDLKIKPGMNATMIINAVVNKDAVTVPEQAVIRSGLHTIVIIAKGGGYFEPREVTIGQSAGGYTEVIEGLTVNEEIVVSSQFLIDSESNLKVAIMKMNHGTASAESAGPAAGSAAGARSVKKAAPDKTHPGTSPMATDTIGKPAGPVYTCPMDPEVASDKPGSCPICGMKLVPKK